MIRSRLWKLSIIDDILNLSYSTTVPNHIISKTANDINSINLNQSKNEPLSSKHDEIDQFTANFLKNRIETSTIQKVILGFGSSLASLIDPHRHDMIACLGETTGTQALTKIQELMQSDAEGQQILADKPRINTKTVNIDALRKLPENTFGRAYVKFLDDNGVTPDSRMDVKFMDDPELAYIMTRYRECHDLIHTILDMPTHMLGEVAVKWVEALNIGLPMCYGGAIFGALRLRPKQRKLYVSQYLPWAISNGKKIEPLMLVYWEKRWEQDITDLRNELNITILHTLKK